MSNSTKAARRAFTETYGQRTAKVVRAIARNWSTKTICKNYKVKPMTVAAYRANVTRNTYAPFVIADQWFGEVQGGSCSW
jgi:FixJ family two-component response regulator